MKDDSDSLGAKFGQGDQEIMRLDHVRFVRLEEIERGAARPVEHREHVVHFSVCKAGGCFCQSKKKKKKGEE